MRKKGVAIERLWIYQFERGGYPLQNRRAGGTRYQRWTSSACSCFPLRVARSHTFRNHNTDSQDELGISLSSISSFPFGSQLIRKCSICPAPPEEPVGYELVDIPRNSASLRMRPAQPLLSWRWRFCSAFDLMLEGCEKNNTRRKTCRDEISGQIPDKKTLALISWHATPCNFICKTFTM